MTTIAAVSRPKSIGPSRLSTTAKTIYWAVQEIIEATGLERFSQELIAKWASLSLRTVGRWLPVLEKAGYITVEKSAKNSRKKHRYLVTESPAKVTESRTLFVESIYKESVDNKQALCDRESHVERLRQQYGDLRVEAAQRYIQKQTNLYNPDGFMVALCAGKVSTVDIEALEKDVLRERDPASAYTSGKYGAFVNADLDAQSKPEVEAVAVDVPDDVREFWGMAYNQLELQLDRASFDTWLGDVQLVGHEDGVLILRTRNEYQQKMLQGRLYRNVRSVYRDTSGDGNAELRFESAVEVGE